MSYSKNEKCWMGATPRHMWRWLRVRARVSRTIDCVAERGVGHGSEHVGTNQYPAGNCVPEISYAVNWLARRVVKWDTECERRLRRMMSYIHGHANDVLYSRGYRGDQVELWMYCDSDYADDPSRRSTSSWVWGTR